MSVWIKKNHYDVLIQGGGISGVSCAHWLKILAPNLKVAVYELKHLGYGATGRNAGFLTCGSINYFSHLQEKKGKDLALEIWESYKENHAQVSFFAKGADYQKIGATTWAVNKEEKDKLEEIQDKFPELKLEKDSHPNFLMGLKNPFDASVHPLKLLKNVAASLDKVDFLFGPESLEGVTWDRTIHAKNGFSNHSLITPQRGQVVLLSCDTPIMNSLGYNTKNLVYFKQLPTLEVLLGGARTKDESTEQTDQLGINPVIQNHLIDFAKEYLGLSSSVVVSQWSGIMGFTPDHQPLAGKVKEGEFLLGGFSGHGMGISFLTAKYLVENMINNKDIPSWMDINRFNS